MLDLQAGISRADGARVHRYLPLGVPKEAREYVRESVVEGKATGARFRVKGDLRHFPFKNPRQGDFRITADVRNVTYAFVPPSVTKGTVSWPALTQLSGTLVFERNGMQVKGARAILPGRLTCRSRPTHKSPISRQPPWPSRVNVPWAAGRGPGRGQRLAAFRDDRPCLAKATGTGNADVRLKLGAANRESGQVETAGQRDAGRQRHPIIRTAPCYPRAWGSQFSEHGFSLAARKRGAWAVTCAWKAAADGQCRAPRAKRSPPS